MRCSGTPQLGSSPHSLQLEKSPCSNEEPAQTILNLLFFKEAFCFKKKKFFFNFFFNDERKR